MVQSVYIVECKPTSPINQSITSTAKEDGLQVVDCRNAIA